MDWRGRLTDSDTQQDLCSYSTVSEHGWDARARTHVHTKTRTRTHSVLGHCSAQWHIFYITHRRETRLPRRHTVRAGIAYKHNDCSPTEFLLTHATGNILEQNKMRRTDAHTLLHTHSLSGLCPPANTSQCKVHCGRTYYPHATASARKKCVKTLASNQLTSIMSLSQITHTHNLTHTYPCVRTSTKNLVSFQRSESIRHKKRTAAVCLWVEAVLGGRVHRFQGCAQHICQKRFKAREISIVRQVLVACR